MANYRPMIAEHAARLRAMHAEIHRTFRLRPHGPDHHTACGAFHAGYDALAWPGGLRSGLGKLGRLEPEAVEVAVQFLEEDPWFYRSGYVKEEVVRRLKHAPLTPKQLARLASVVSRSLTRGTGRLARHVARLAPLLASSPDFVRGVESQAGSDDAEVRRRAGHVLRVLAGTPAIPLPPSAAPRR
jgi:hypothetical protein